MSEPDAPPLPDHMAALGLSRASGELCWDGCSLAGLARDQGTPLYVLNPRLLVERTHHLRAAFRGAGLSAAPFFSVKTNPVPEVLTTLFAEGVGAEVNAPYELELVTTLGLRGERIVVGGTLKSDAYLGAAVSAEVALISVETLDELERVSRAAVSANKTANVALRLNPSLHAGLFDFTLDTGTRHSPFGFALDGSELTHALESAAALPGLRVVGVHFHIGTNIERAAVYGEACTKALGVLKQLKAAGHPANVLNIGGGFGSSAVKLRGPLDALRGLLGRGRAREGHAPAAPMLDDVAAEVASALSDSGLRDEVTVFTEPGRYLVADALAALVTVGRVQAGSRGRAVAFCDGGAMTLSPLFLVEHHEVLLANRPSSDRTVSTLRGPMPMSLDVLHPAAALGGLETGDIVAVMGVGAYYAPLGNTWWGPRPPICAIKGGLGSLVRRRETFAELVSRDVVGS